MDKNEISLDYRECTIVDITTALMKFHEKEVNLIRISNIYPGLLEKYFDMEIDDENGFDMDWWGTIKNVDCQRVKIPVFGCCRYGYARIERDEYEED